MDKNFRRAYIAEYDNGIEKILFEDTYCSPDLMAKWDNLVKTRQPEEKPMQMWYYDYCQSKETARWVGKVKFVNEA